LRLKERSLALSFRASAATLSYCSSPAALSAYLSTLSSLRKSSLDAVRGDAGGTLVVPPFESLRVASLGIEGQRDIARFRSREIEDAASKEKGAMHTHTQEKPRKGEDCPPPRKHTDRIRVGYITPDISKPGHPLPYLMRDFWTSHNASSFDVTIYSLGPSPVSGPGAHIKEKMGSKFVEIPLDTPPVEIASKITSSSPDVLVDLCSHAGTDLVSLTLSLVRCSTPAPIVNYMGFPGSHGSPHTTHQIVDSTVVPPSLRSNYDGSLIFMPNSYFYGLPPKSFVYGNLGRPDKLDPATISSWFRILSRAPGSVLLMLSSGPAMEANVLAMTSRQGIHPSRVAFCPDYMERGPACDKISSRVGASLCRAAGGGELVGGYLREYEDIAVRLYEDEVFRERVKEKIMGSRERLFGCQAWVKQWEEGIKRIVGGEKGDIYL
ncbi:hypothetical protein TrRE_jg3324, partial [Triparma retinervis]